MEGYKPRVYPEGTQSVNMDDIPQEEVDAFEKYLEGMTQEEAKLFARNFGAPDALYDLLLEIKRDDFQWAEFIYNGVKYLLYAEYIYTGNESKPTGQWIVKSDGNGKLRHMVYGTKEELIAAPEFDGNTIEEIADQIDDYELSREPVVMID